MRSHPPYRHGPPAARRVPADHVLLRLWGYTHVYPIDRRGVVYWSARGRGVMGHRRRNRNELVRVILVEQFERIQRRQLWRFKFVLHPWCQRAIELFRAGA